MRSLRLNAAGEVDRLVFSVLSPQRNTLHNTSMQIGNRFRCYPSPAQAQTLLAWIGCKRFIYNAKVGEDRYFRRFTRQSLTHTGAFAPIPRNVYAITDIFEQNAFAQDPRTQFIN